jgi:hypothetical protein
MPHHGIERGLPEETILKREQVRHPGFPIGLGNLAVGREGQRGGDDPQRHPHADLERRAELQSGVFTQDIGRIMQVCEEIEASGVQVNDVSEVGVDQMPYGDVKNSGSGREGPKLAIEEITEPRLLVMNLQPGAR